MSDVTEGPMMEAPGIPEETIAFIAAQKLGHALLRRFRNPGTDFGGEVKQGINHGSIIAGPGPFGKMHMKKRAVARFSRNQ